MSLFEFEASSHNWVSMVNLGALVLTVTGSILSLRRRLGRHCRACLASNLAAIARVIAPSSATSRVYQSLRRGLAAMQDPQHSGWQP